MPIHDWTRVRPGIYHDFHGAWIAEIRKVLQAVLPEGYFALIEQITGAGNPDVLTLQDQANDVNGNGHPSAPAPASGVLAVATQPPGLKYRHVLEARLYQAKTKGLTIRHASSDDRIVAMIGLVSPGNKASRNDLSQFVAKVRELLEGGIHVTIIDPFPPGPGDPNGMHAAIWAELGGPPLQPPEKPLTLAAYVGAPGWNAFFEPLAVGDRLPPAPVFLSPDFYVSAPLEEAYAAAFGAMAPKYRRILESATTSGES